MKLMKSRNSPLSKSSSSSKVASSNKEEEVYEKEGREGEEEEGEVGEEEEEEEVEEGVSSALVKSSIFCSKNKEERANEINFYFLFFSLFPLPTPPSLT